MGRFQALFDVLNPIFDSLGLSAGGHLTLPLHNDAITPTLAFGDGDTGFYEEVDDRMIVAHNGAATWRIANDSIRGMVVDSPSLRNEAATATNPTLLPLYTDTNTGVGSAGPDILSLIAGEVEALRLTEIGSAVSVSGAVINTTNGLSQLVAAPAASNSAGTAGQIAYDATYFYVCIASSTWERVELASW